MFTVHCENHSPHHNHQYILNMDYSIVHDGHLRKSVAVVPSPYVAAWRRTSYLLLGGLDNNSYFNMGLYKHIITINISQLIH